MSPVQSSVEIVAYLALFFGAAIAFVFINLLVGWLVRPRNPHEEKLEIYECGEPTIGSSFVQFDLRFYVVALLFIIFDVEVAFFFPWATVFGKATNMADKNFAVIESSGDSVALTTHAANLYKEMGVRNPKVPETVPASLAGQISTRDPQTEKREIIKQGSRQLALISIVDIAVFFGVLMVGFFYVWRRGDLDWVRAVTRERSEPTERAPPSQTRTGESVLTA